MAPGLFLFSPHRVPKVNVREKSGKDGLTGFFGDWECEHPQATIANSQRYIQSDGPGRLSRREEGAQESRLACSCFLVSSVRPHSGRTQAGREQCSAPRKTETRGKMQRRMLQTVPVMQCADSRCLPDTNWAQVWRKSCRLSECRPFRNVIA